MKISERIPHTEHTLRLQAGKKVYFVSDVHLGAPVLDNDRERENRLIRWLDTIRPDCGELFLLGDIFDFWFEYKRAVPKGHVRFLAKICEFTDQGIPVHFFTGNHDIWAFGYLPEECGVILHTHNEIFRIAGKRFLIGHGDALNPQDKGYLFLYRIFHNRFLQRCFRWLHPDIGILIARKWSSHSRLENGKIEADAFRGGGIWLVVLSIICISVVGAAISMLFFYRLSKPIRQIAVAAKDISTGHLQTRIAIKGNVAEMHEIADSINALGESLLNQEKFRQELIVSLSHELRTPLQILLSQLEAMLDGIYEADRERLEAMRAEVARTGELLNELEDRLIYENDAFDLNITQVNVSDLAHRVAIGHEGGFAQKKLDFIYNIEPDVIIEADSVRLAQVLINLLSNSIKYTQAGGASLSLKREGRNVVIEITDSGEGMDEETAKNIINRSSQAFKAVNSKGVGLYIAKLIVDKHGWALDIESHKGRGTTVRIIM